MLAFMPALMLGGYWFGGEGLLLYMALIFPALFAWTGLVSGTGSGIDARDGTTGLKMRKAAVEALDQHLAAEATTGLTTAAIAISLDDLQSVERQFGTKAISNILSQTGERIAGSLRNDDLIVRLEAAKFGVVMEPVRRADLETLIQLSGRIQGALAEPYSIDATRVYVTATVGFCTISRAPSRTGQAVLEAAETALANAAVFGAGSLRAYSPESKRREDVRSALRSEICDAFECGHMVAWFQPQVSTDTGAVTGFEALARWEHPKKGLLAPDDFLPAAQEMGLMERLGEVVMYQALNALRSWDKAGFAVPAVSVNFSSQELRNPKLCEKIQWELDRFELGPERLCVEILENVVADSQDDTITRNISALSKLGCRIDLDDFGTGHASIANIRRFAVNRIKIDRSFVTRVDRDREQQNMVAAVLTMADRLGIDTLAEGAETVGEHAMLAQLGCGHVQGFSIARPMPLDATSEWIKQYNARRPETPALGQKAG